MKARTTKVHDRPDIRLQPPSHATISASLLPGLAGGVHIRLVSRAVGFVHNERMHCPLMPINVDMFPFNYVRVPRNGIKSQWHFVCVLIAHHKLYDQGVMPWVDSNVTSLKSRKKTGNLPIAMFLLISIH